MITARSNTEAGRKSSLQKGLHKVNSMITWGRRMGHTQAAINLENWRDAKGNRVMPASSFKSQPFLLDHLRNEHRARFVEGARKRLATKELTPAGTVEMDWTDSVDAPANSDLWFALGGFTVHSHVRVQAVPTAGGKLTLRFIRWETDISDVYNWDKGKMTMIPFIGRVTDDEMLALERAGHEPRAMSVFRGASPLGGTGDDVGVVQTLSHWLTRLSRRTPPA